MKNIASTTENSTKRIVADCVGGLSFQSMAHDTSTVTHNLSYEWLDQLDRRPSPILSTQPLLKTWLYLPTTSCHQLVIRCFSGIPPTPPTRLLPSKQTVMYENILNELDYYGPFFPQSVLVERKFIIPTVLSYKNQVQKVN